MPKSKRGRPAKDNNVVSTEDLTVESVSKNKKQHRMVRFVI
jgi:hypothetical protein